MVIPASFVIFQHAVPQRKGKTYESTAQKVGNSLGGKNRARDVQENTRASPVRRTRLLHKLRRPTWHTTPGVLGKKWTAGYGRQTSYLANDSPCRWNMSAGYGRQTSNLANHSPCRWNMESGLRLP
jgi:hypothetical protein